MDWSKYPRVKALMDETGMTLNQLYKWIESECERRNIL
jgi:hypothetical protein